jgi:DNA-binding transcriptional MerR regulator
MARVDQLVKQKRKELFSVEETKNLSSFSRSQLLSWENAGIVVPIRRPSIFYNWNQVIFLRILYDLRKDWSFKQIEKALKNSDVSVDDIVRDIHKTFLIAFGDNNGELGFAFSFENPVNDFDSHSMQKILNNPEGFDAIFQALIQTNTVNTARIKFNMLTVIKVFEIIDELKVIAKEKQIEYFDMKVS